MIVEKSSMLHLKLNEEKKKENILKSLDKGLNIVLCILYIMHLFEADRIYNEEIVETIVEYIKKCVELLFKKKTGDEGKLNIFNQEIIFNYTQKHINNAIISMLSSSTLPFSSELRQRNQMHIKKR